jgi:glc operon protein GlcG
VRRLAADGPQPVYLRLHYRGYPHVVGFHPQASAHRDIHSLRHEWTGTDAQCLWVANQFGRRQEVAGPALAEARQNNWTVAVAVVDPAGILVYFEKMDNTQVGSADIAIGKARSAVLFKRPTKVFQETLAAGGDGLRILGLHGAVPLEGGIPLLVDGKIIGAIGVSGATTPQDGQCAKAGAELFK